VLITLLTILFLVAMWVAVLAAPLVQNRGQGSRSGDSIKSFQRQLATLERTGGRQRLGVRRGPRPVVLAAPLGRTPTRPSAASIPSRPSGSQVAAARRRRVFTSLTATALLTLALAFLLGGVFVWAHLLCDALLAGYVVLVFQTMKAHAEREMNVAFLPHLESVPAEPVVMLREVAQGR